MIKKARTKEYKPGQFVAADMENDPAGSVLAIGAIGPNGAYNLFNDWSGFLSWIVPKARKAAAWRDVYFHNGANYDYLSLIKQLREIGQPCQINYIMLGGKGVGATLRYDRFSIRLKDSLRILPASLARLGHTFDIEHKKVSGDPWGLWQTNKDDFYQYLEHDVKGLREILLKFEHMINTDFEAVGKMPWTLPSLALKLWQFTIKKPIRTPWNDKLRQFSRLAYSGGRCEAVRSGVFVGVNSYDVNSMYPSVMRSERFPSSYVGAWTKTFSPNQIGLYEVTYEQPKDLPPLLRDLESREFSYSGKGVFCTPELNELIAIGGRFQVYIGYDFWITSQIFKPFIDRYWKIRRNAQIRNDPGLDYVAKLIMNGLYGKLAQSGGAKKVTNLTANQMRDKLKNGERFSDYGSFQVVETEDKKREHEFTAIAAFVTCYARLKLWEQIKANRDFLYCDTDSIHLIGTLPADIVGNDLGQWKLVQNEVIAAYAGRKSYAMKFLDGSELIKWKGIPAGPLTFSGISSLANKEVDSILCQYETPPTAREALLLDHRPGVWLPRERTAKLNSSK